MDAKPPRVSHVRALPLALTLLFLASTARADGKAAVKQAEALLAEQENNTPQALTLLREAHELAPDDVDIAFDRARIALEHSDLAQPADFDDYLRLEPLTADQRLLRAYILAARGRSDEARTEAQAAATADPTNNEALGLVEALAPAKAEAGPAQRAVQARVKLFGQYDTNVSVLPDRTATTVGSTTTVSDATNFQRSAAAIGVEGDVRWTPVRGLTELSFVAGLSFLGHVNGRSDEVDGSTGNIKQGSKLYDFGTIDLQARLAFPRERWNSAIELYGSSVFIDDFSQRYLTEGTLLGSTNVAVNESKSFRIGAYGLGGIRSFGDDFSVRDGQRAEGGLTFDYIGRRAAVGLRGSYQGEFTQSEQFTEKGPQAMFYVRGSLERFDALASFVYQRRDYNSVANTVDTSAPAYDRADNRYGPTVQLSYALSDILSLIGTYQYIRNVSTVEGDVVDFDYSRHLATLGLEARL
jgi:tetratricopeptide (TPR) repeat protein